LKKKMQRGMNLSVNILPVTDDNVILSILEFTGIFDSMYVVPVGR